MCGRFAVGGPFAPDWDDWLGLDPDIEWPVRDWPAASWNIAPTQPVGIIGLRGAQRRPATARWGLIPDWWAKPLSQFKATTFNARSEDIQSKPMFRDAWARKRCLIPALGYYEWSGPKGDKTPWFITSRRNTPGVYFAGLWSMTRLNGDIVVSCTIMTTTAGEATRHLHPRSPVVLSEEGAGQWLDLTRDPANLMRPLDDERVELWQVDPAVGKVSSNGAHLIERIIPAT